MSDAIRSAVNTWLATQPQHHGATGTQRALILLACVAAGFVGVSIAYWASRRG